MHRGSPILAAAVAAAVIIIFAAPATATNHTVGGTAGWFFNSTSNSSVTNYGTWAASRSFSLGDFIIFNTNSNTTVVQTYNATTYKLCDASSDNSDDTFVFTPHENTKFGVAAVIAVPLTVEGVNYYFSDAGDDRIQCVKGMRFSIKVGHGKGLPPELSQPPPPPSVDSQVPPPPPAEPATVVPGGPQEEQFYRGGVDVMLGLGIWGRIVSVVVVGFAVVFV